MKKKRIYKEGTYDVTISDGFCSWKFPINPKKGNIYSIDDIHEILCKRLKAPKEEGILVKLKTI